MSGAQAKAREIVDVCHHVPTGFADPRYEPLTFSKRLKVACVDCIAAALTPQPPTEQKARSAEAILTDLCWAWNALDQAMVHSVGGGQFKFVDSPEAWTMYHLVDDLTAEWQTRVRRAAPQGSDEGEGR